MGVDVEGLAEGRGLDELAVADGDGHVVDVAGGAVEQQVPGLVGRGVEPARQHRVRRRRVLGFRGARQIQTGLMESVGGEPGAVETTAGRPVVATTTPDVGQAELGPGRLHDLLLSRTPTPAATAQRWAGTASRDVVGASIRELRLPVSITQVLLDGSSAADELHLTQDRLLVVNQSTAQWEGHAYGTVATLRDHTELAALTGELDTTKALAESLRSQAHEAANRLHTMVVLVETGRSQDAVRYATTELELSQQFTDRVMAAVEEPVLIALLLGKAAQANERGVELIVTQDSRVPAGVLPTSCR